jgi:flagellar motor switch protein FliN/FliY
MNTAESKQPVKLKNIKTEGAGPSASEGKATEPRRNRPQADPSANLAFILDIPLEISVELGKTEMLVNDLLKLGQGSVIELSKLAGETLEILANRRLVARGEVVVINEKYGVRVTEIISPMERVKKLR